MALQDRARVKGRPGTKTGSGCLLALQGVNGGQYHFTLLLRDINAFCSPWIFSLAKKTPNNRNH